MKVLFLNDSTSNANWGDRAAALSLKRMVTESGGRIHRAITEDELGCSDFRDRPCSTGAERESLPGRLSKAVRLLTPPLFLRMGERVSPREPDLVPRSWEEFAPRLKHVLSHRDWYSGLLRAFEECDLVVAHGDGCMTGFDRMTRALLFLAYLAKEHCGKPVIMVNHTVDFTRPELKEMAQHVYPLFDDVVYRDTLSLERNRDLCDGRFAPDSAFLFEPMPKDQWVPVAGRDTYFDVWPDVAQFNPEEPYLCVGGSSIFFYHGDFDARGAFFELVRHLRTLYRGQIVLTVSDLRDQEIFRPVAEELGLPVIGLTTPVQQAVDVVGNAEAYIGGRWHPSIFALRGGAPIVPISSLTFKVQALAEMCGLSPMAFDALGLEGEKEAIGRQLMTLLEQGDALRSRLKAWAQNASVQCWENVAYLARHASRLTPAFREPRQRTPRDEMQPAPFWG